MKVRGIHLLDVDQSNGDLGIGGCNYTKSNHPRKRLGRIKEDGHALVFRELLSALGIRLPLCGVYLLGLHVQHDEHPAVQILAVQTLPRVSAGKTTSVHSDTATELLKRTEPLKAPFSEVSTKKFRRNKVPR